MAPLSPERRFEMLLGPAQRLEKFAREIGAEPTVAQGKMTIEKDGLSAHVTLDANSSGQINYELRRGDRLVMGQERTTVDALMENMKGQLYESAPTIIDEDRKAA